MPPRGVLFAVLAVFLLAGCASAPPAVPVPAGSRIVVRLYDAQSRVELALANESYPEMADLYSRKRQDAALKLAPDRLVGELLYSLDEAGLDVWGRSGAPEAVKGGEGYLWVDTDGLQRVFPEPGARAPADERQAWSLVKLVMTEYYKHVGGLQVIDNPEGHDLFRDAR